ncbi:MAG TPA: hypothetical protein VFE90_08805 [Myxococcales bacterium]|jgi:hypothetical protein|nr:hypothetical protein [Myxococcales bacterium]
MRNVALLAFVLAACATGERRGFPSLDHTWGAADFVQAGAEADRLSGSDVSSLPRRGDPVFNRLVDLSVGDDVGDESQPLGARGELTRGYMESSLRLMRAYGRAGPAYVPEVRELLMAFFANGCEMMVLLAKFDRMPDKELANPDAVHEGMARMRSGVRQLTSGVLTMLHPREGVPDADRIRYAELVASHLPHVMPLMPDPDREAVYKQLDGLVAREKNPAVRTRLARIRIPQHVSP